jgi:hypothetical protein
MKRPGGIGLTCDQDPVPDRVAHLTDERSAPPRPAQCATEVRGHLDDGDRRTKSKATLAFGAGGTLGSGSGPLRLGSPQPSGSRGVDQAADSQAAVARERPLTQHFPGPQ